MEQQFAYVDYEKAADAAKYEKIKEDNRQRSSRIAKAGRNIGKPPKCADPDRRASCRDDFRQFCLTYQKHVYTLPFSDDHLQVISRFENVVQFGGNYCLIMARGSGKTSLSESATLWSLLYSHRQYPVLLGASVQHAQRLMASIKSEFLNNPLIGLDWPEVVFPLLCLENIWNRTGAQHIDGVYTKSYWGNHTIIFPTVEGSDLSGRTMDVHSFLGATRGLKRKLDDGSVIRPDLAIVDDPQTDESAASPTQTQKRLRILNSAILGMSGPTVRIASIMPTTNILPDDLVDKVEESKEWKTERYPALKSMPRNEEIWKTYFDVRREDAEKGNEFYIANREAMDEGCVSYWPERFNADEVSSIQSFMNIKLANERTFWSEYMGQPKPLHQSEEEMTRDVLVTKINNRNRGIVPSFGTRLTAMIDPSKNILHYLVLASDDVFNAAIIDYGIFPRQARNYVTKGDAYPTIETTTLGASWEAALYNALGLLVIDICKAWMRDEDEFRIEKILIDANWDKATSTVYEFCRQSPFATVLLPSHGAGQNTAFIPKTGDRCGVGWAIKSASSTRARRVVFDTNYWKSFVASRMQAPIGGKGSWTLFGTAREHTQFYDHLLAEKAARAEIKGRVFSRWEQLPAQENDWFDCLVGATVAASIQGANLITTAKKSKALDLGKLWEAQQQAGEMPVELPILINNPN